MTPDASSVRMPLLRISSGGGGVAVRERMMALLMVRVGLGFDSLYRERYLGIWSHAGLVMIYAWKGRADKKN